MPLQAGPVRLASSGSVRGSLARRITIAALLLGVGPAGSLLVPSLARAADPAPEPAAEPTAPRAAEPDAEPTHWGPILGACVGVLFGGILAVWQIRGMKRES